METELQTASTVTEDMLYRTCIDGINDPWDPSILTGHKEQNTNNNTSLQSGGMDESEGEAGHGGISRGYRTQSLVLAALRSDLSHGQEGSRCVCMLVCLFVCVHVGTSTCLYVLRNYCMHMCDV